MKSRPLKKKKANKSKAKSTIPRRKDSFGSFILTLVITLVALAYARIVFIQEMNIQRVKKNIAHQTNLLEQKKAERDEIVRIAESVNEDSFIINNARDRLGLVMPNEKVIVHSDDPVDENSPVKENEEDTNSEEETEP